MTDERPILLYQPYCDQIGHFKEFHAIWREYLLTQDYVVLSVLGTTEIPPDETTVTFSNTSTSRTRQILRTLHGLRLAFRHARRVRARAIYIQDFEITTFMLARWLFGYRLPVQRICLHQHAGNFHPSPGDSRFFKLYRSITRRLYTVLLGDPRVRIIANGSHIAQALRSYTHHGNDASVLDSNWGTQVQSLGVESVKRPNSFLFAGIIRSDKNLDYLLREFAQLPAGKAHLHIAGIPFDYTADEIRVKISQSAIPAENITFEPSFFTAQEWADRFRASEFIIIPYRASNQSSSGPLIDALQFGCIPIVSDYGERGYITRTYDLGLRFDFEQTPLREILGLVCSPEFDPTPYRERIRSVKSQFTWSFILHDLTHQKKIFHD